MAQTFNPFLGTISTKIHYSSEASNNIESSFFRLGTISTKINYSSEASKNIESSFFRIIKQTWLLFKTMFLLFLGNIATKIHYFPSLPYRGYIFFWIFGWLPWLPYKRHNDRDRDGWLPWLPYKREDLSRSINIFSMASNRKIRGFEKLYSKLKLRENLQASISRSIVIFPMASNRKLRGKLYIKLDPERIAEFNHKELEAMTYMLKPMIEKRRENISRGTAFCSSASIGKSYLSEQEAMWVVKSHMANSTVYEGV